MAWETIAGPRKLHHLVGRSPSLLPNKWSFAHAGSQFVTLLLTMTILGLGDLVSIQSWVKAFSLVILGAVTMFN